MLFLPSLAVIASLAGAINAQTVVTIDPDSVDSSTRGMLEKNKIRYAEKKKEKIKQEKKKI